MGAFDSEWWSALWWTDGFEHEGVSTALWFTFVRQKSLLMAVAWMLR